MIWSRDGIRQTLYEVYARGMRIGSVDTALAVKVGFTAYGCCLLPVYEKGLY